MNKVKLIQIVTIHEAHPGRSLELAALDDKGRIWHMYGTRWTLYDGPTEPDEPSS
jgi:hypothetical protein